MRGMSDIEASDARPDRRSSAGKRIEDPHLDVGMLAQMHEAPVLARGVQIVDQHSHPHAAIRGTAHVLQQDPRGLILVNDVVLNVERPLGVIGERDQLSKASSPEISRRIPDRSAGPPSLAVATMRPRVVDCGERSASLGFFCTCCGRPTQARSTQSSAASLRQTFAHRAIISGTLCTHADPTSHSQFRVARRPHHGRAGTRARELWPAYGIAFGRRRVEPAIRRSGARRRAASRSGSAPAK